MSILFFAETNFVNIFTNGYVLNLFTLHQTISKNSLPIVFSPKVNYHHASINNLHNVLRNSSNNQYTTNYLEVVPFAISKNSPSFPLKIESVYTVTNNNEYSSKAIDYDHKGKFLQDSENDNIIQFLKSLNNKFLDEKNFNQFGEDFEINIEEKDTFISTYLNLKQKFQQKYKIYFAYIEGVHRSVMFAKIGEEQPITNNLQSDPEKDTFIKNHAPMKQHYYVRIYVCPKDVKVPTIMNCQERSHTIRKRQNIGFKCTYANVIGFCRDIYFSEKPPDINGWLENYAESKDQVLIKRKKLLPLYLKMLLRKGPIAEKFTYSEDAIDQFEPQLKDQKLKLFLGPRALIDKSNGKPHIPRESKIFLDLLSFASVEKNCMETFYHMFEGMNPIIPQDKTLQDAVDFNDSEFYLNLLWCVRLSAEYLHQHHSWFMHKQQPTLGKIKKGRFIYILSYLVFKDIISTFVKIGRNPQVSKMKGNQNKIREQLHIYLLKHYPYVLYLNLYHCQKNQKTEHFSEFATEFYSKMKASDRTHCRLVDNPDHYQLTPHMDPENTEKIQVVNFFTYAGTFYPELLNVNFDFKKKKNPSRKTYFLIPDTEENNPIVSNHVYPDLVFYESERTKVRIYSDLLKHETSQAYDARNKITEKAKNAATNKVVDADKDNNAQEDPKTAPDQDTVAVANVIAIAEDTNQDNTNSSNEANRRNPKRKATKEPSNLKETSPFVVKRKKSKKKKKTMQKEVKPDLTNVKSYVCDLQVILKKALKTFETKNNKLDENSVKQTIQKSLSIVGDMMDTVVDLTQEDTIDNGK